MVDIMNGFNALLESLQRMLTIVILAGVIYYAYQYQVGIWELQAWVSELMQELQ